MKTKILLLAVFAAVCGRASAQVNNARMLSTPNAQTGTTYAFVAADTTRVVTFNNASPIAATLPNGATFGFGPGTMLTVLNVGVGTLTITCSSCTISANGSTSSTLILTTGEGADIYGGMGNPTVNYSALVNPGSSTGIVTGCFVSAAVAYQNGTSNTLTCSGNFTYVPASGGLALVSSNVGPANVTGSAETFTNSIGGGTTYFVKGSDGSFRIRHDALLISAHGDLLWDNNGNVQLNGAGNSPVLNLYVAGCATPAICGTGSAIFSLNNTGLGPHVFGVTGSAGSVTIDPYLGGITFYGGTSGSAGIGINASAGSPCFLLLPTTSPSAGQSLTSAAPSGGNCTTSWANSPIAASLVTTAAGSDNVTVTGMTASGHCTMTPTNATASGLAAVPYISNKTTNQITVTHSVTANANFDILCTPY